MLSKLDKGFEWLANWIVVLSGVAVCTLIFVGAVMRYIFHTDFYGSEELILLAAFWLYFFGSALAAKHNTHIQAEMLDMFVKNEIVHNIAYAVRYILNSVMCVMASVWSVQYVVWNISINMKSNVFKFPMFFTVLPIAISFLVWTLYSVRDIVLFTKSVDKKRKNKTEEN